MSKMENTLDSIQPSDETNAEMSFLFGRDPSILAGGQRPYPVIDSRKNLLSLYEVEEYDSNTEISESSLTQSKQTLKVYLRMKPFPKKMVLTREEEEAYVVLNSKILLTKLPTLDSNTSFLKRSKSIDSVCRRFTFTHIFGPETSQLEIFEQSVKEKLIDFLAGENCTIMSYGTSNSGKTYTLQGSTLSPGIIPRSLEFVFSNISPKPTPSYKPVYNCDIICLDSLAKARELESKTKLLTFGATDKNQYVNTYKQMQRLLQEESPIRASECTDAYYSIWVSFAEIYNETVYDLLSNECPKRRPALKLATDNQGRAYIKDLKMVSVNSGAEAYQVLMAGQYNLKVAATALNARSSRSHCIFTIKLLKYRTENNPNVVDISTFAFCDLAGSERLKKTLNIGDRLKEAQNINTSLLVLGRCLKSIYDGQAQKQKEHSGPFRESKLTRLFQWALCGKEKMSMIVNVNPIPNLYVETQNVLCFSAIAKKIVLQPKENKKQKKYKGKSKFSLIASKQSTTTSEWNMAELNGIGEETVDEMFEDTTPENDDAYDELLYENKKLKDELANLKNSMILRDLEIRKEMADTYTVMMRKLEVDFKNRIRDVEAQKDDAVEWSVKQVEDFYKQKINQMSSRKRKRTDVSNDSDHNDESDEDQKVTIQELEDENTHLNSRIISLKEKIAKLKESQNTLIVEKNKLSFELSSKNDELKNAQKLLATVEKGIKKDEDSEVFMDELKAQLVAKQEHINKLKEFLNEAKEEYIAITKDMQEKEQELQDQEGLIAENEDKIEDLESQLEHANICLEEKTKAVDIFEEKLEQQYKLLLSVELKSQDLQKKVNELEKEKQALLDEKEKFVDEIAAYQNKVMSINKHKDENLYIDNNNMQEVINALLSEKEENVTRSRILEENNKEMQKRIEDCMKEKEELSSNFKESEENKIKEMQEKIDILSRENEEFAIKSKILEENSKKEIQKRIEDCMKEKEELSSQFKESDENRIKEMQEKIDILSRENEEFAIKSKILEENSKKEIQKRIEDCMKEKEELSSNFKESEENKIKEMQEKIDILSRENEEFAIKSKILEENSKKEIQKQIEECMKEKEELSSNFKESEENKIKEMQERIDKLTNENQELIEKINKKNIKSKQLKEKIDELSKEIKMPNAKLKNQMHFKELNEIKLETVIKTENIETSPRSIESDTVNDCQRNQILTLERDNSTLQEKLMMQNNEIESLKEQLNIVQINLNCAIEEKNDIMNKNGIETITFEKECQASDKSMNCENVINEGATKSMALIPSHINASVQTNETNTKEEVMQTSFITETQEEYSQTSFIIDENEKKCVEQQLERIQLLEQEISKVKGLEDKNQLLEEDLIKQRNQFEAIIKENKKIISNFEEHLNKSRIEKDEEIYNLQKEIKKLICNEDSIKSMEFSLKSAIKELSQTKEMLSLKDEQIQTLKMRIETYEQNAKFVELVEQSSQQKQAENNKLRNTIEDLKKSLNEKELERVSFLKNRDLTVGKYENLVKSLQEELERQKREVTRYQELFNWQKSGSQSKDDGKKQTKVPESEEKVRKSSRTRQNTNLQPPEVSTEKRRTRRKKLFVAADDSIQDIEQSEVVTLSPNTSPQSSSRSTSTRSLRSRKK